MQKQLQQWRNWLQKLNVPFWPLVGITGLISFVIYPLTGNTQLAQLLFLIVFTFALVKAFFFSLQVLSVLAKVFLLLIGLLLWVSLLLSVAMK